MIYCTCGHTEAEHSFWMDGDNVEDVACNGKNGLGEDCHCVWWWIDSERRVITTNRD